VTTLVGLMRPSNRGAITLAANDPDAPPVINHQLIGGEDDAAQLVEGLQIARRIMGQPALAGTVTSEVRPGPDVTAPEALRGFIGAATIPMYHPVGTAKMGAADDAMAVLTPDCRVKGVDGLWVADASVMPTLPQGNTNATSIMIGERASALVLEALG